MRRGETRAAYLHRAMREADEQMARWMRLRSSRSGRRWQAYCQRVIDRASVRYDRAYRALTGVAA